MISLPTDDQNTQMPGAPVTDPTVSTPADMTAQVPGQAINDQMTAGQAPVSNDQPMMSGASTPAAPMASEPVAQTPPAPTTTPMGTTPTPMDMGAGSMQTPSTGAMPTDGTGDQAA